MLESAYTNLESSRQSWNTAVAGIDAFLSGIIITPSGEPRQRATIVAFSDCRYFEAGGSGLSLDSRGPDNHSDPKVTYPSWGEFQKKHSSE